MATKRIQNLFRSVNDRMQSLLEFDRFYAALYDSVRAVIEFPWVVDDGQPKEWNTRPYQGTVWLLDKIIHTKAPLLLESDLKQALEQDEIKYWPDGGLPQSWLAAPMIVEDRVIGVLVVENRRKTKAFGENGIRVFSTIARQAAVAIENVRLVDQRDRKIASLRALYEMGQQLNSEIRSDEPAILHLIYQQASQLMDTSNLFIALYAETTDTVSFPLMFVEGITTHVESRSGGKGRTEWIIQNQAPILIETHAESVAWYTKYGKEYIGEPFASWVGVPMMVGDKVLGVIATYHKTLDYVYTEDDQEILSLMANQAAVALENANLYRQLNQKIQELQDAQSKIAEREALLTRSTIAADIVHRLNNLAGTIPIRLDQIREHLGSEWMDDKVLTDYLNSIEGDAGRILRAGESLKSPAIEQNVSVDAILNRLVRQSKVQMPPEVDVELTCVSQLPPVRAIHAELSHALWSIIENGMDAMPQGGQLTIEAKAIREGGEEEWIELRIRDEGVGIAPEEMNLVFSPFHTTKAGHLGYGLWRARNTIERMGGSIRGESEQGRGTIFTIRLPASKEADKHE